MISIVTENAITECCGATVRESERRERENTHGHEQLQLHLFYVPFI